MERFKFAFILKLMLKLFGITNELSKILQRKDLNIVLAMDLINVVKARLAALRDSGWDNLFVDVQEFVLLKVFQCQIRMKKYRFGVVQDYKGGLSLIFTITGPRFFMLLLTKYVWRWIIALVKEVM